MMQNILQTEGFGAIHVPRYVLFNGEKREKEDEWYKQLVSERYEEISPGKMGWKQFYKRNEPLDTYIYAVAAAEFEGVSRWNLSMWADFYYNIKTA
jgi:phage terminase large subunit GpA-like protein